MKKNENMRTLRVCIVDEHSDALESIHLGIRSKKVPFKGFKLLHFDAHPDLCVTTEMRAGKTS